MSNSTVKDIGGDPLTDGCQGGVGIEVGLALTSTTADSGSATLTSDTVESYQKNGITVDGTGSSATITGVTTIGAGPSPAIAQNNTGSGAVLLVGNAGSDQLIGSGTGETWIIGHAGTGNNVINGNGGSGFIQERGDTNDTLIGTGGYTVVAR